MTGLNSVKIIAILKEDVYSNFNINDTDRQPYGRKGEEVMIVHESLPALIVETKKGGRFSVNVNKVTYKTENIYDKEINGSESKEIPGPIIKVSKKTGVKKRQTKARGGGLPLPGLY